MTQFCRIDPETGIWQEDVVLESLPCLDGSTPDPAYIVVLVPQDAGFVRPRWNAQACTWEEGGTPPVPVTPELTLEERQDQVEAALMELAGIIAGVM